MSALGHKRTLTSAWAMSALPPKADMVRDRAYVRFVPKADKLPAHLDETRLGATFEEHRSLSAGIVESDRECLQCLSFVAAVERQQTLSPQTMYFRQKKPDPWFVGCRDRTVEVCKGV